MPSCNVVMPDGRVIIFVSGTYRTDKPAEIDYLEKEIAAGHPHLFIDQNEATVDSEMVDPMNALRAKIIAEYLESEKTASGDPERDMGKTEQTPVKPASTQDVAPAMAGGSGEQLARLVSLKTK
jgi:hypothetical protein